MYPSLFGEQCYVSTGLQVCAILKKLSKGLLHMDDHRDRNTK